MSTSHIVVLNGEHPNGEAGCLTLRCNHCGTWCRVKLPIATSEFSGVTNGFIDRHRHCSLAESRSLDHVSPKAPLADGHWQCPCGYANVGPICTKCSGLRPVPSEVSR